MSTILAVWHWLSVHETITAGILALLGISAGIVGNAVVLRRDRDAKRNDEKSGLQAALLGELKFLCKSYAYREAAIANARRYFDVPLRDETDVYDRLLDRIVLLTPTQTEKVVNAYISAKHLLPNLQRLTASPDEQQEPLTGEAAKRYIRLWPSNFPDARRLHVERIALFDDAIKALQNS